MLRVLIGGRSLRRINEVVTLMYCLSGCAQILRRKASGDPVSKRCRRRTGGVLCVNEVSIVTSGNLPYFLCGKVRVWALRIVIDARVTKAGVDRSWLFNPSLSHGRPDRANHEIRVLSDRVFLFIYVDNLVSRSIYVRNPERRQTEVAHIARSSRFT